MQPGSRRYLIPAAALFVTFIVGGLFVFWILSLYGGDESPPTALPPTLTATTTTSTATPTATTSATPVQTSNQGTASPGTATQTASPTPAASRTPSPTPEPAAPVTSFAGTWRIVDTIAQGPGVGQVYAFNVTITQTDAALRGGAPGAITFSGTVATNIATVEFTQPTLGVTGIFIWTMQADGNATGTFTSSIPNSGTSRLERLR